MLLLTLPKAAEYAIKMLICLALSAGRPIPAREVARCVRIPPSQAAKILHFLRWVGLTGSRRGSSGGYLLTQRPEDIRVEQVVQFFRLAPDKDSDPASDPLQQIWSATAARSQHEWEQLTIAELARRTAGQWNCSVPGANENLVHEN